MIYLDALLFQLFQINQITFAFVLLNSKDTTVKWMAAVFCTNCRLSDTKWPKFKLFSIDTSFVGKILALVISFIMIDWT